MTENKITRKQYTTSIKSIDEENLRITFQVSDDSIDRYGEKVDQKWELKNFKKNPIFIWNHRGGDKIEPEDVLGGWEDFTTDGGKSFATAQFDKENPNAKFVFGQYARRFLRAVSVGFIPHTINYEDDVPVLTDNELLEISAVPIPANPNAIALAYKSGQIRREDALWLMKSMQDATKHIEAQLKEAPDGQEKQVEEVISKLDTALEAIEATSTKLAELDTKFESVSTELETIKSTVSEVKAKQEETPTPPAKGGDIDQPGAGAEVEIDEDAELTPEQQAEFEAELAEQLKEGDSKE